jgi:hypothetical protein
MPDAAGEAAAFGELQQLADALQTPVQVIMDLDSATFQPINPSQQAALPTGHSHQHVSHQHVWCMLDAVDGTLKLAGLGNAPG